MSSVICGTRIANICSTTRSSRVRHAKTEPSGGLIPPYQRRRRYLIFRVEEETAPTSEVGDRSVPSCIATQQIVQLFEPDVIPSWLLTLSRSLTFSVTHNYRSHAPPSLSLSRSLLLSDVDMGSPVTGSRERVRGRTTEGGRQHPHTREAVLSHSLSLLDAEWGPWTGSRQDSRALLWEELSQYSLS